MDQLVGRQPRPLHLCPHQPTDEVVPWLLPPRRDQLREVRPQGRKRAPSQRVAPRPPSPRLDRDDRLVRPLLELRPVAARHPQDLRDHDHRQGMAERFHQVEAPVGGHGVEQLIRDLPDARPQLLDCLRRERLRHQRPQPRVLGRVAVQQPNRPRQPFARLRVEVVLPRSGLHRPVVVVPRDLDALVMPEHEPDPVPPPELHRHPLVDTPHLFAPRPAPGRVDPQRTVLPPPRVEVVWVREERVVLAPGRLRRDERLRHAALRRDSSPAS